MALEMAFEIGPMIAILLESKPPRYSFLVGPRRGFEKCPVTNSARPARYGSRQLEYFELLRPQKEESLYPSDSIATFGGQIERNYRESNVGLLACCLPQSY
jgi:hypothetical protein